MRYRAAKLPRAGNAPGSSWPKVRQAHACMKMRRSLRDQCSAFECATRRGSERRPCSFSHPQAMSKENRQVFYALPLSYSLLWIAATTPLSVSSASSTHDRLQTFGSRPSARSALTCLLHSDFCSVSARKSVTSVHPAPSAFKLIHRATLAANPLPLP